MIEFYEIMDLRFTGYVLSYGLLEGIWKHLGALETQSLDRPCFACFQERQLLMVYTLYTGGDSKTRHR